MSRSNQSLDALQENMNELVIISPLTELFNYIMRFFIFHLKTYEKMLDFSDVTQTDFYFSKKREKKNLLPVNQL